MHTQISPKLTGIAVHALIFRFISLAARNIPINPQMVLSINTQSGYLEKKNAQVK